MPMELILNKKKVCVLLMCLRFKKKSVLKLFDRTVFIDLFDYIFLSNTAFSD